MANSQIRRVRLRNYKSIAACDVHLQSLTFIVGANGSGKSNFLDGLRFVSDAIRSSVDHALRDRGTIKEVRRRSGGHPTHFATRLDFSLPDASHGHYSFRIGAKSNGGYEIQDEECFVQSVDRPTLDFYRVRDGQIARSSHDRLPAVLSDRLLLVAASGIPEFRPVYDALSRFQVYNLNPREIASMQSPDPGLLLSRDGRNAASVLSQLDKDARETVEAALSRIVPGVEAAEAKVLGSLETIEFRQTVKGQSHPWRFPASGMSDGTLRAFGLLLAIYQTMSNRVDGNISPTLIGLEEPETALHPAAASVLLAALRQGAEYCQTLVTSHNPDLLDNPDISSDSLLATENVDGITRIGLVDEASRSMLKEHLFTAGELLRQNQLAPSASTISDVAKERQLGLFDTNPA